MTANPGGFGGSPTAWLITRSSCKYINTFTSVLREIRGIDLTTTECTPADLNHMARDGMARPERLTRAIHGPRPAGRFAGQNGYPAVLSNSRPDPIDTTHSSSRHAQRQHGSKPGALSEVKTGENRGRSEVFGMRRSTLIRIPSKTAIRRLFFEHY